MIKLSYIKEYNTREYVEASQTIIESTHNTIWTDYVKVEISTITHPVGGIYAPSDRLSVLSLDIALVGLIGAISTIFVIRRWRKDTLFF